jgi:F0F1-type ATP synthase assembly protein I
MSIGKVIGLIVGLLIGFVIGFILVSYWNDPGVRPAMRDALITAASSGRITGLAIIMQ